MTFEGLDNSTTPRTGTWSPPVTRKEALDPFTPPLSRAGNSGGGRGKRRPARASALPLTRRDWLESWNAAYSPTLQPALFFFRVSTGYARQRALQMRGCRSQAGRRGDREKIVAHPKFPTAAVARPEPCPVGVPVPATNIRPLGRHGGYPEACGRSEDGRGRVRVGRAEAVLSAQPFQSPTSSGGSLY